MLSSNHRAVVFAITSDGNDFYTALTRVAVASLRISNPSLSITVACDCETDRAIREVNDSIIDEIDDWLVVETPAGDAGFRNRFVKTKLRELIDGPFLYLDSDVLVRGNLNEIFVLDTDIAGARNHSRAIFSDQIWDQDLATLNMMGWTIGTEYYVNGGVFFFNDTPGARRFSDEWHQLWMESFMRVRNYRDQPALNAALYSTKAKLVVLPDHFNAQFKKIPSVAKGASVWHYYASAQQDPTTCFELLVKDLVTGAQLDRKRVARMVQNAHPWRSYSPLDDWAAAVVMKKNQFNGIEWAILRRVGVSYVRHRVRSFLNRIIKNE